ncbi:MAG: GNAT family N-acetyltransferase [Ramlibacter sp.]|nr:GNAT family N-acetyltransferase [Ramlibacter sp.]
MSNGNFKWHRTEAAQALGIPETAQEWDRLNLERGDLPFMSAAALANALEVFGSGNETLFTARLDGGAAAMFILAPDGLLRWTTFQPSQVPLGAWVAASRFDLTDLAQSLIDGPLGACMALSITQIDPLYAIPGHASERLAISEYIHTGWVDVSGTFEDYWAERGKNLRQNMRKQRNKLATEGTSTEMRELRSVDDIAPALARYGELESSGWKAGQGTAIHYDNPQGRFYLKLFQDAAMRGEAVIYEYLFDDRTVAMNLGLVRNGQLIVLKTAYDESVKTFSPASLLREEELQTMFANGDIRRIEYYGRLMEWHTKLTENKRTLYHLTVYRWGWVKQLAARRRVSAAQRSLSLQQETAT